MMSIATDTVLSTPELLEHILAQLPMRQLLITAPLVNKTWQAITLLPALQRALFFQPDPTVSPTVHNPLLVQLFPPFFAPCASDNRRVPWPGNASSIKTMPWANAPDAFKRPEASWRRMLVTQPPPQTLAVTEWGSGQIGDAERRGVVPGGSPLCMGFLYDLAVPLIDHMASAFRVHWHNLDNSPLGDRDVLHSEEKHKGDSQAGVTLMVSSVALCRWNDRVLDRQFFSEAGSPVTVEYGKWVYL
ncbi:hypothetical protein C8R43DRAFT_1020318, partial [Mycena crocata]